MSFVGKGNYNSLTYNWANLTKIPDGKRGIYAWYYQPRISDRDISILYSRITDSNNIKHRNQILSDFFRKNIFDYYTDLPFEAHIKGALKPKYSGSLIQEPICIDCLFSDFFDDLDNLQAKVRSISDVLCDSIVSFSCPLYIGTADNLLTRIMQHRNMIEKCRLKEDISMLNYDEDLKGFGRRVVERNFLPSNLLVTVFFLDKKYQRLNYNIESILNRISYPILGRN